MSSRHYEMREGDVVIGEIICYLANEPASRWWAYSSVNDDDGGRGFATEAEAQNWLRVNAAMAAEKPTRRA